MEIVYRKLSELKPNPKNPRTSTREAIENLAESIKDNPDFFEARPILLSDRTGELVIIGGEQRFNAAKHLKLKTVPTILFTGLSEEREDFIMTRDNTHAGVWDEKKLREIEKQWGGQKLKSWGAPELPKIDVSSLFKQESKKEDKKYNEITIVVPLEVDVQEIKNLIVSACKDYDVKIK